MWLGRIDFRLLETMPDHSQRVNRAQVEATLAIAGLMGDAERKSWSSIDATLGAFVGETDAMTPAQIDLFKKDLGVSDPGAVASLDEGTIRRVIVAGKYGAQRISSHVSARGRCRCRPRSSSSANATWSTRTCSPTLSSTASPTAR